MEERVLRGDKLFQPVIPQPLAYLDMLEHRSPEGNSGIHSGSGLGSRELEEEVMLRRGG